MIQGKTNIAKGMSFLDDNHNRLIGTPVGLTFPPGAISHLPWGQPRAITQFHAKSQSREAGRGIGKYTSIWMRQQDGSSELVLDRGNASPAPMYP